MVQKIAYTAENLVQKRRRKACGACRSLTAETFATFVRVFPHDNPFSKHKAGMDFRKSDFRNLKKLVCSVNDSACYAGFSGRGIFDVVSCRVSCPRSRVIPMRIQSKTVAHEGLNGTFASHVTFLSRVPHGKPCFGSRFPHSRENRVLWNVSNTQTDCDS